MKYSGIGGQAVLEGIMMKNGDEYALAVRKSDGEVAVEKHEFKGTFAGSKITRLPFVRGTFNFIDSLVLGMKTIMASADYFEEEEDGDAKKDAKEAPTPEQKEKEKKKDTAGMAVALVLALGICIVLFILLPAWITGFLAPVLDRISNVLLRNFTDRLLEGIIRIIIFVLYIVGVSVMKDIRRTYMYHGAEHKCINCIEHGKMLTVENVRASSRFHKRCGTSFLLIVMLISVVVFMFIPNLVLPLKMICRLALLPVVAGISYEFLRLAGRSDNVLINVLSAPGLWLQRVTTKEPDDEMIQVGIASVEAVFDWKKYLRENFPEQYAESEKQED